MVVAGMALMMAGCGQEEPAPKKAGGAAETTAMAPAPAPTPTK
jgi:PBP1b-binding outer membrane lipoprotein LpoB